MTHPRARIIAIASALLFMACSNPKNDETPPPPPDGTTNVTFSGVTFAGTVSVEPYGYVVTTPQEPLYREFQHVYSEGRTVTLTLLVPSTIYKGTGTYSCGSQLNTLPRDLPYCTIKVTHVADPATYAVWGTSGVYDAEGNLGAIPGCNITVTEASTKVRGTVTCPTLRYQVAQGAHPDIDHWLAIDGEWAFDVQ